jgi:predicted  nucleic acid-binding Zn-ribbon protein
MKKIVESLFALQSLKTKSRKSGQTEVELLKSQIPPHVFLKSEHFRNRGKNAVAIVRSGVCTECHIRLAVGSFNSLLRGTDLQTCGNCGRYLYLPQDEIKSLELNKDPKKVAETKAA